MIEQSPIKFCDQLQLEVVLDLNSQLVRNCKFLQSDASPYKYVFVKHTNCLSREDHLFLLATAATGSRTYLGVQ